VTCHEYLAVMCLILHEHYWISVNIGLLNVLICHVCVRSYTLYKWCQWLTKSEIAKTVEPLATIKQFSFVLIEIKNIDKQITKSSC
jgi:hypothetical protein